MCKRNEMPACSRRRKDRYKPAAGADCRRRVVSLVLAGLLAAAPVMNVLAVEVVESNDAGIAENSDAKKADEIISIEDANEALASYNDEEAGWEEIYIDSVDSLKAFSRKCRLDTWSQNKKVYLTEDLNLAGSEFVSIPTFGGCFDGQGHTISGLAVRDSVSYTGLFSYTQRTAVITGLHVQGTVRPAGSRMVVGGIVGDNSGIVINCSFEGIVEGSDYVGAIAGFNEQSGILMKCTSRGKVTGAHYTGGIAGENAGNIAGCTNEAEINTSNEDKSKSIEDISLAQYTSGLLDAGSSSEEAEKEAAVISNTIDTGGIAGLSTGIIQFCSNSGKIGYEHVGYNTGGIAGRQSGYVYACENTGTVCGRKDVGGIAGQTEPYIAIDLTEDITRQLMENIDKMHELTGQMLDDAGAESDTLSNRLAVVQNFVDKALDDTSFLADRTVGWTDEMIGSVNDAMGRFDYIVDESTKNDGFFDQTKDAAGNVKDAAAELEQMVESLDIYAYMSPEEKARYDSARENLEKATKQHAEDYAEALEAYENYYIDYIRSGREKYQHSDRANENDLKPRFESGVDTGWTWNAGNDFRDYVGVTGWVHVNPDTGEEKEFPQSEGDQGTLDHELVSDAAEQMAIDSVKVEQDASDYADQKYREAHDGSSYAIDMQKYLDTMSEIVLAHRSEMTEDAAKRLENAAGHAKDAAGNLESAGGEAKNIFNHVNDMPDISLPQLGGDYRSTANSLASNLKGLSENMGYLNDEMSSTNDVLIDDLADINDQFSTIMRLYTDAIDGVLDMDYSAVYEDTSQEDAQTSTDATIADSCNRGVVKGDINVAGVAGTMAIEYDFDLEGDVTGIEDAKVNSTFLTKCVLRKNVNTGKVTAQKSCAGGISGLQEMGTILECENYGRIISNTGNYVGGIAGQSLSHITKGYAKCTLSGEEYVAGIAGSGSGITDCCAMVRILDATAFSGAIAGEADSGEKVSGNYFVSDEIAGIDRISYSGKAEPVDYEEMLQIEGLPDKFRMMTVSFYADEEEVRTVECPYGGSVSMDLYPEIPAKSGFYADWDIKDLDEVVYDEDVTVEYVRYLTTLASEQTRENKQSVLLADGKFRREDELTVTGGDIYAGNSEASGDGVFTAGDANVSGESSSGFAGSEDSPEDLSEYWTIMIPDDGSGRHQIRYQAPQGQTEGIRIYVKQDDKWAQADTELMGIYHLFTVEGTQAQIAVCIQEKSMEQYLIYIIPAAVVLIAVVALLVRRSSKSRKRGEKEAEKRTEKEA